MSADHTKVREPALILEPEARPLRYREALLILQEHAPWVLQSRDLRGRWRNAVERITGRTAAHRLLEEFNDKYPKEAHRVLPQNEAQRVQEGFALALEVYGIDPESVIPLPSSVPVKKPETRKVDPSTLNRRAHLHRNDPDWKPIKRRFWSDG